jgi:hypothetical protein
MRRKFGKRRKIVDSVRAATLDDSSDIDRTVLLAEEPSTYGHARRVGRWTHHAARDAPKVMVKGRRSRGSSGMA